MRATGSFAMSTRLSGPVGVFLLSLVASSTSAADLDAQASPVPSALAVAVNVCRDTGFFDRFLNERLALTGNCDDADGIATFRLGPAR
jgi:hypothetical protein